MQSSDSPSSSSKNAYWAPEAAGTIVEWSSGDLLRRVAAEVPQYIALKEQRDPSSGTQRQWTYAELLGEAERAARFLLSHFSAGERVAIWAPNRPEWIMLQFGAALAGIVVVAINPASRSTELAHALTLSQACGIVLARSYRDVDTVKILHELRPTLPLLREVFFIESWGSLDIAKSAVEEPLPSVAPSQPAMLQFTSGTTGKAKAAMLSHRGLVNIAQFTSARFELPRGSIWLSWLPMFHTGGSVFAVMGCMWNRGTLILTGGFEPASIMRAIAEERPAWLPLVPTAALALLDHPDRADYDLSSLRVTMQGGTPVAPELIRRVERELQLDHMMIYGQTETSSTVCLTMRKDSEYHKTQTVGKPMPYTEVRIVDADTGLIAAHGESGEVHVRNCAVMLGYFGQAEETAKTIDADGWLHTGDLGAMEPDGYLRITGRLTDLIIRGGENIYPREIEDLLAAHPAIVEAAVFGVPDPRWGETVVAAIRTRQQVVDLPLVQDYLEPLIARHKIPQHVWIIDDLPLTLSGKIQKFALRDAFLRKIS